MALFLGLMKVAEAGGLLTIIAKTIRPLMMRAFPDVPANHPAMGAMILNMSANALGLGNAATPFGIRAPCRSWTGSTRRRARPPTPWCSSWRSTPRQSHFLPTGVIALRASAGSMDPGRILPTTLFATLMSTMAAFTWGASG